MVATTKCLSKNLVTGRGPMLRRGFRIDFESARRYRVVLLVAGVAFAVLESPRACRSQAGPPPNAPASSWETIAPHFLPPSEFEGEFGDYRSPLQFSDGSTVKTAAETLSSIRGMRMTTLLTESLCRPLVA